MNPRLEDLKDTVEGVTNAGPWPWLTEIAVALLGMAAVAFCVWLGVRIVNWRERWARWTAVGLAVPLLYVAGFGPACLMVKMDLMSLSSLTTTYRPCVALAVDGPQPIRVPLRWWTEFCGGDVVLTIMEIERLPAANLFGNSSIEPKRDKRARP